jgi:replicative DNA helicase Mcm
MTDLGTGQENILVWWYQHHSDETFSPAKGYTAYQEETDYEGEERTFSNLLLKLHDKQLLNKPRRGKYRLSEKGKNKADYFLNPDKYEKLDEEDLNFKDTLVQYLSEYDNQEFQDALLNHQPYKIQISELDIFDPDLVDELEERPFAFEEAAQKAAEEVSDVNYIPEIRIVFDVDHFQIPIYKARSGSNLSNTVTIEGTIETTSKIHNVCQEIRFHCVQCGDEFVKKQSGNKKQKPYQCDCGSKSFDQISEQYDDRIVFTVGVQKEQNENIKCVLETEEITERSKEVLHPGNKVRITGKLDVEKKSQNKNRYGDPYIDVLSLQQKNKTKTLEDFDREKIEEVESKVKHRTNPFNDFAKSLAPHIVDTDDAKKVVAASLIGGSTGRDDGRIHSLIISNPGMGKTDILEFNKEVFPNSHYADGKNSSGVGLTATVEQEQGGVWRLKAGKLVYADKGLLAVDEFDKMQREDAERLNTAMVKPTFPVDKAGVNAELPGQATIIAAGNFEEYLETTEGGKNEYIQEYIPDHAESLIDRFSLVYAMQGDDESEAREEAILSSYGEGPGLEEDAFFDNDEMVIYRELAKDYDPILTEVSQEFLKEWLRSQKNIGDAKGDSGFKKDSNRYLVSLAKLTTMFARSRFAERTNENDAQRAIELVNMCRKSRGLSDGESDLNRLKSDERENKLKIVRDTLEDLQERNGDGVMPEDIADNCPLDVSEVESVLDEMESEIQKPKPGRVKLLN